MRVDTFDARVIALRNAGLPRTARVAQNIDAARLQLCVHLVLLRPRTICAGHLLTRHQRLDWVLVSAHYREQEKAFSVGDRIQFTAPNHELKIANRELGTVENIAPDGAMRLKLDNGRSMDYEPQRHPHLDHGYAVTSYSSQGQTADRVLIHVDTALAAKDLLNSRMAYVSVSRGQWDAQIFTNDHQKLPQALGHDVSHQSAHKPEQAIAPMQHQEAARSQQPGQDLGMSMGTGLGL